MTIPSAFKFNNTITNNNVAIATAMASELTPPINTALSAALLAAITNSGLILQVLKANLTYYIRTDGHDTASGLNNTNDPVTGAFLTLNKARDVTYGLIQNGFTVTFKLGNTGTYNTGLYVFAPFSGPVIVQGDTITPTNTILDPSSLSVAFTGVISVVSPCTVSVDSLQINGDLAANATCIYTSGGGSRISLTNIVFGPCNLRHIWATTSSFVLTTGNYSILGAASAHLYADTYSVINTLNGTVTLIGTPAFSTAFANGIAGCINASGMTYSGAATGVKYQVAFLGFINSFGGGVNLFPGSVAGTGGTTVGGGVYG